MVFAYLPATKGYPWLCPCGGWPCKPEIMEVIFLTISVSSL